MFWKRVSSLKSKRNESDKIGIPIDSISDYYKNFFIDDRTNPEDEHTKLVTKRVAEYEKEVDSENTNTLRFELRFEISNQSCETIKHKRL